MKKIKVTQEVSRQKIRCLFYTAYMLGYLAKAESHRPLTAKENFEEIHNIIKLLDTK